MKTEKHNISDYLTPLKSFTVQIIRHLAGQLLVVSRLSVIRNSLLDWTQTMSNDVRTSWM